ncbi:hypothetical protein cypCar_00031336 [Cyprinus carpio]|nr:hypothetical protein cypCar_00031336 [Cyprinus carpio]
MYGKVRGRKEQFAVGKCAGKRIKKKGKVKGGERKGKEMAKEMEWDVDDSLLLLLTTDEFDFTRVCVLYIHEHSPVRMSMCLLWLGLLHISLSALWQAADIHAGLQTPMLKVKSDIVSEGEDITATCSAPEETGNMIFYFFENDLEVKRVTSNSNSVKTILTTQKRTEIYLQCAYMVMMHPNAGFSNKSNKVKVIVRDLDVITPQISISPKGNVVEGDMVQITCKVNYPSDLELYLTKNNTVLHESHTTFRKSLVVRAEDSGEYVCKAEKGSVQKMAVSPLHVAVPVSAPVVYAVDEVIVGKTFRISCEAENGTLPITYTLLKTRIPVAHRRVVEAADRAIFNITSISFPEDINTFTCQAYNGGSSFSKTSEPLRAPVIVPVSRPVLEPKELTVTEGSDLPLICRVHQGTYPITFTWYHNRVMLLSSIQKLRSLEGRHVIKDIDRDQRGDYYCEASNYASEPKKSYPARIGVSLAQWKKAVIGVFCILLLVAIVIVLTVFFKNMSHQRRQKQEAELSVKPSRPKSGDPMRISLTLDIEDNTTLNGTPCVMGRNVWSENVSGSDSDDHTDEESELVQPQEVDPSREVPEMKSIEPEYSVQHTEIQVSTPGELRSLNHTNLPFEHDHNRQ